MTILTKSNQLDITILHFYEHRTLSDICAYFNGLISENDITAFINEINNDNDKFNSVIALI